MASVDGSDNESKLIAQSLSGDPEAYAALVSQHQTMIRAMTFRMTGSQNDAEELAQDAFLRAYQQLGSFRRNSKFSTWLCKIAINLSLDWRRRERRRDAVHPIFYVAIGLCISYSDSIASAQTELISDAAPQCVFGGQTQNIIVVW